MADAPSTSLSRQRIFLPPDHTVATVPAAPSGAAAPRTQIPESVALVDATTQHNACAFWRVTYSGTGSARLPREARPLPRARLALRRSRGFLPP